MTPRSQHSEKRRGGAQLPPSSTVVGLLAVASVVLLAACGTAEPDSNGDKIVQAVDEAFTSVDPESCSLFTRNFFAQASGGKSRAARRTCEQGGENGGSYASAVEVSGVKMTGKRARAYAEIEGGVFHAQGLTLALIRRDGQWRIDEVEAVQVNDRRNFVERYVDSQRSELRRSGFTRAQTNCMLGELREASDSDLEELVVEQDPPILMAAAIACSA